MQKINWTRLIIGGLVAAVIMFMTDGFFHEKLVKTDWEAVYAALNATRPADHGFALAYFALFELGRGMITLLLYVTLRVFCGAGPKTAVCAAIAGWVAFSVTTPAQFIPLGLISNALWIKMCAFHLVTSIVATLAGAALYKD